MDDRNQAPWRTPAAREQMNSVAFWGFVGALCMLFVGFGVYHNAVGLSQSGLYNLSVPVLEWTLKIGGGFMFLGAACCLAGWPWALLVDAVVTGLSGLLMVTCGGIWIAHGDTEGVILAIFGIVFLHSARGSWVIYHAIAGGHDGEVFIPDRAHAVPTEAPPSIDADRAADKADALKRLLAQKREENDVRAAGRGAGLESAPRQVSAPAPAAPPPKQPDAGEPPVPNRLSSSETEPAPPADQASPGIEPNADEPAPEGFLADFGRDDRA